jgi:hypothetical protein
MPETPDEEVDEYELGYRDGENSQAMAFKIALLDIVPPWVDGESPQAVAEYVEMLQARLSSIFSLGLGESDD